MDHYAIDIQDAEVYYKFEKNRSNTLKEFAIRFLRNQLSIEQIRAIDGVSLKVNPGETFGIIGRNGSGKSTLLKLICRIVRPTKGRVRVWGEIRSLLSVGAGFNPDMTGRENIFIFSAMLGRTNVETKELMDEIISFSEISRFIDSPIRIYSTGMIARLGFSIAMVNTPDILIIDEVLAVGDASFREKCMRRINDFRNDGATIVIVTHNMNDVRQVCQRVAWLRDGKVELVGSPEQVVLLYEKFSKENK